MFRKLTLFLILTGLLLTACSPALTATPAPTEPPAAAPTLPPIASPTEAPAAEPTVAPVTVTDGLGREVTLTQPATRIVSLAASNTEIMFALGAGGQLIARDETSNYPAEALDVPSIGSLYPNVNAEAVVALEPDLVLAAAINNPDDVKKLEELGLTVYSTRYAVTLDDIYADILDIGTLVGKGDEAGALVGSLKDRVEAVEAATATVADRPVVFYEVDATEPEKPWTAGTGTFIDLLVGLAGGQNAGAVSADYFQISFEELIVQDPDVIVLGSATYGGQTPELVAARPGWDTLKAVQNNAIYAFDDNLVSRPGPRIVDGLETMAKLIHPELFK